MHSYVYSGPARLIALQRPVGARRSFDAAAAATAADDDDDDAIGFDGSISPEAHYSRRSDAAARPACVRQRRQRQRL